MAGVFQWQSGPRLVVAVPFVAGYTAISAFWTTEGQCMGSTWAPFQSPSMDSSGAWPAVAANTESPAVCQMTGRRAKAETLLPMQGVGQPVPAATRARTSGRFRTVLDLSGRFRAVPGE